FWPGHRGGVTALRFCDADGRLLSGGADGRVFRWDPGKKERVPEPLDENGKPITWPDAVTALCCARGVVFWGTTSGRVYRNDLSTPSKPPDARYHTAAVTVLEAGQEEILSAGQDGRVFVWPLGALPDRPHPKRTERQPVTAAVWQAGKFVYALA